MRHELRLPQLRVLRQLSGRVWVAEHERLGCEVAVKFAVDPASAARLSREALTSAAISSPSVVRVLGSGRLPSGESFLVSELAPGEPLASLLARGVRLSVPHLLDVAAQLAWAIERLHRASIAHGGVDPTHVMLQQTRIRPRVRLLGLAHASHLPGSSSTASPLSSDLAALAELLWSAADTSTQALLRSWHERATADREVARFASALELADAMSDFVQAPPESMTFDADHELEALRILLASGDAVAARARLETSLPMLFDADRAREAAIVLAPQTSPVLDVLRLRSLVEHGDPVMLAAAALPTSSAPEAKLEWARVLFARGKPRDASEAAPPIESLTTPSSRAEGALLLARCEVTFGERARAVELLSELVASTPGEAVVRDALLASVLSFVSNADAARANRLVSSARRRLDDARPHERRKAVPLLAQALYQLGRPRDALLLLDAPPSAARTQASTREAFVRACCLFETGEIERAAAELTELKSALGADSSFGPFCDFVLASVSLARGRVSDYAALLPELRVRGAELPELAESTAFLAARARQMRRERPPARVAETSTIFGRIGDLYERAVAARWNLLSPGDFVEPSGDAYVPPEMRSQWALLLSHKALAAGDADGALRAALEAVSESRAHGHALYEVDARTAVCEALSVSGDRDALAVAAAGLAALARRTGSDRALALADLFVSVAGAGPERFGTLERIANTPTAGEAASFARVLLGGEALLDVVDQAVLSGLRRWVPASLVAPVDAVSSAGPSWGLDEDAVEAWLPTGARVSFRDTPLLWRLLSALAEGPCTKEHLAKHVWDERAYHPHRHDNRLQAAVRKLRVKLSDADRALVRTAGDGYALGGKVRRARSA